MAPGRISSPARRAGSLAAVLFWHGVALSVALSVALAPVMAAGPSAAAPADDAVMIREVHVPFDEAVLRLTTAITSANFRVTGENDIGEGLRARGHADFPRYKIIHFCSLELARKGVLIDPRLGAIMPCRAAVYEQDGKTIIAMIRAEAVLAPLRNPALNEFQRELQAAFTRILDDAVY